MRDVDMEVRGSLLPTPAQELPLTRPCNPKALTPMPKTLVRPCRSGKSSIQSLSDVSTTASEVPRAISRSWDQTARANLNKAGLCVSTKGPIPAQAREAYDQEVLAVGLLESILGHPRMVELRGLIDQDRRKAEQMLAELPNVSAPLAKLIDSHRERFIIELMAKPDTSEVDAVAAMVAAHHLAARKATDNAVQAVADGYMDFAPKVIEALTHIKRRIDDAPAPAAKHARAK